MKIHMVKSGDTMYNIAQKYGVTLEQLIAFNPQISNPEMLDVGMKVKIPSTAAHGDTPGMEYAHKHIVVQGDSLWKIAKAWGLPLKALIDANPQLKNPSVLLTGEVVYIPKISGTGSGAMNMPGMNTGSSANVASTMPNASNSLSPAYTPPANIAPANIAPANIPSPPQPAAVEPAAVTPQPIIAPPSKPEIPISKPIEQMKPIESKPIEMEKSNKSNLPMELQSNSDQVNVFSSESLFMQFEVPAVQAEGKAETPAQTYQMPAGNAADMPQWGQPMNYGAYGTEDYAAKPDCGCGCGGKANAMPSTMPNYGNAMPYDANAMPNYGNAMPYDANAMPNYGNAMPYDANAMPNYGNAMPYNPNMMPDSVHSAGMPYPSMPYNSMSNPYSSPTYYVPQPMLAYSMQQAMPGQFPASAAPGSSSGYMIPCYPMGAYGDMGYQHGMQTPYSPWSHSSEGMPSNQLLAGETSNNPPYNPQESGALGMPEQDSISKKRKKGSSKSTTRTNQTPDSVTILQEFLQKKSNQAEPIREYKINEPWMNR